MRVWVIGILRRRRDRIEIDSQYFGIVPNEICL